MMILFLAVAVMVVAAAAIGYPLFFQRLEPYALHGLPDSEYSERDALLEALSELEREFLAGKLSDPDYESQKQALQRDYLRAAEAAEAPAPGRPGNVPG